MIPVKRLFNPMGHAPQVENHWNKWRKGQEFAWIVCCFWMVDATCNRTCCSCCLDFLIMMFKAFELWVKISPLSWTLFALGYFYHSTKRNQASPILKGADPQGKAIPFFSCWVASTLPLWWGNSPLRTQWPTETQRGSWPTCTRPLPWHRTPGAWKHSHQWRLWTWWALWWFLQFKKNEWETQWNHHSFTASSMQVPWKQNQSVVPELE